MTKYFQDCAARLLWHNFVSISINIILLLFCCVFKANVLLMLYILYFFYLWFSFSISCLVSADMLYAWSAYLKDDLPFSFRMKCWFLCCFTCGKDPLWLYSLCLCYICVLCICTSKLRPSVASVVGNQTTVWMHANLSVYSVIFHTIYSALCL